MKKTVLVGLPIIVAVIALSLVLSSGVQAGTKDLAAGKRNKFQDDKAESMRDGIARREAQEQEFREKILANSDESIELLREIRSLLKTLNIQGVNRTR